MIGEIGMLRMCGWAALLLDWSVRFLLPVFLGICCIATVWCGFVCACAILGMIRGKIKKNTVVRFGKQRQTNKEGACNDI